MLLFPDQFVSSVNECSQFILENSGFLGSYPAFEQILYEGEEGMKKFVPFFNMSYDSVNIFDDIVGFPRSAHILDQQGKLYLITREMEMVKVYIFCYDHDKSCVWVEMYKFKDDDDHLLFSVAAN